MSNPQPVRLEGLREFRAGLKRVKADAPKIFNRSIKSTLTETTLPRIKDRTPKRTRRLAGRTRISVSGANVAVTNSLPYANAIHWGRTFWPNAESPKRRPAPIKASRFVWDPIEEDRAAITRELGAAIGTALETALPK